MDNTLHITSGDRAGGSLERAGLPGEVFVWHDVLYDGPRRPGWPDKATVNARAAFLEDATAGGLDRLRIIETLRNQYRRLSEAAPNSHIVLWFDACLFDQSMLVHILTCLRTDFLNGPAIRRWMSSQSRNCRTSESTRILDGCRRPLKPFTQHSTRGERRG